MPTRFCIGVWSVVCILLRWTTVSELVCGLCMTKEEYDDFMFYGSWRLKAD
jgi:hypothetical protein